jgi:hypothetical protein
MSRFYNEESYINSSYPFPDMDNTSEEDKDKSGYNLEMCKAIWNLYMNNKTAIGYSLFDYYNLFRLYAQGKQPSDIYKTYFSDQQRTASTLVSDAIDGSGMRGREQQVKGWMNVDFDNIFSFMPKLCRILEGYFSEVDSDIRATNIDIDSGTEEENAMLEYWGLSYFLDDINELSKNAGLPIEKMDYRPESLDELKVIKEEGGFKQPYIMDLEKLLKHTEERSKWGDIIKNKLLADLRDLGCAFTYRFFNEETCTEEWEYLDPTDVIIQYSKHKDFTDSDIRGFKKQTAVSELRSKGFTEDQLAELAKNVCGLYGNPTEDQWNKHYQRSNVGYGYNFQDFRVDVLHLYWTDVSVEKKIKFITSSGKTRYLNYNNEINKRKETKKSWYLKNRKNFNEEEYEYLEDQDYLQDYEQVKITKIRMIRHCKWIIGTDMVYDYGYMENIIRPKYNKPENPIIGFMIPGRSMTDILTKPSDFFNMGAIRFENTLSRAVESGYAVDKSVMAASGDGGKKFDELKALQMHRETGYFIYDGMPDGIGRGGSPVPITALPGTLADGLTSSLAILERCNKFVEDLTGMSLVSLGASPPKESQVGTQKMSLISTQAGLRPYEEAIKSIKAQLANSSAEAIQLIIKNDPKARKEYSKIIGKDGVNRIRKAKKLHIQYGINLVAKPKMSDINDILNSINLAYQKKQQGLPGIDDAQRIQLIVELKNGANIYHIIYKMEDWIRKDQKRIQSEKDRAIELQGEQLRKQEEIKAKNAQELEKLKMKNIVIEENIKANAQSVIENRKTKNKVIEKLVEEDSDVRNYLKKLLVDQGFGFKDENSQVLKS